METGQLLAFIGLSTAVIVIPGPSILLILSNSLEQGRGAGFYTVVGVSAAMLVQLGIVVLGLSSVVQGLEPGLDVLRWFGIAYLCYLGIRRWRSIAPGGLFETSTSRQYQSAVAEGAVIALTNPTTLLFFIAFFPQFLTPSVEPLPQLVFMSATFWVVALVFDIAYAMLAGRVGKTLAETSWVRLRNHVAGAILIVAALMLAVAQT